jgi:hypothetical protein
MLGLRYPLGGMALSLRTGLFIAALLFAASCHAQVQSPPGFDACIALIPLKGINPAACRQSALENTLCGFEFIRGGSSPGNLLCLAYSENGAGAKIKLERKLGLSKGQLPHTLLPENRAIVQNHRLIEPGLKVSTTGSGGPVDISPDNLDTVALEARGTGAVTLSVYAADSSGDLLVQAAAKDKRSYYWCGKEELKPIQGVPSGAKLCSGFDAGGLQTYFLTSKGKVLKLDAAKAEAKPDPGFGWVAAAYAKLDPKDTERIAFVLAEGIVGFKLANGFKFCTKAGSEYTVNEVDPFSMTPSGRQRSKTEGDMLTLMPQPFVKDGRKAGLDQVTKGQLVPVNRTAVGIFDPLYCRLTVFKAK